MRKLSIQELNRPSAEAFREAPKRPVLLVLDNIRSALNVGSAFRTADGFALQGIVLCGISAQPPHREILKTALGATETVEWEYESDVRQAVEKLQADGWQIWAVEQAEGSIPLQDFNPTPEQPIALVFGNEVNGVSEAVMDIVDGAVEIPQFGAKHSLNVSVCIGIVAWEIVRKTFSGTENVLQ